MAVLLTKWGLYSFLANTRVLCRSCLAALCRPRVTLSQADLATLSASSDSSPQPSPRPSPRADDSAAASPRPSYSTPSSKNK